MNPDELKFSWSIANPTWREWTLENREALELFLQGPTKRTPRTGPEIPRPTRIPSS